MKYLDQVSVLDSLLAEEKKQVANALVELLGQGFPSSACRRRSSSLASKDAFRKKRCHHSAR